MGIKDDVARLKRLGNPNSPQWNKVRKAIIRVAVEKILPLFPLHSPENAQPRWHTLPRGYELRHLPESRFMIRKSKHPNFAGQAVGFRFGMSNDWMDLVGIMEFSYDLYTGWLEEVEGSLQINNLLNRLNS